MSDETTDACTCPSGDGSLRWPCPTHQPTTERVDRVARALAQVEGQPYEQVSASAQAHARAIIEAVDTATPTPRPTTEASTAARAHARVMRDMGRPHSTLVVLDDEITRLDAVVTAVREVVDTMHGADQRDLHDRLVRALDGVDS